MIEDFSGILDISVFGKPDLRDVALINQPDFRNDKENFYPIIVCDMSSYTTFVVNAYWSCSKSFEN